MRNPAQRMRLYSIILTLLLTGAALPRAATAQVHDMTDQQVRLEATGSVTLGKRTQVSYRADGVTATFNGIALQGFSDASDLEGWVRFREGGGWGPWQELYLVRSATDGAFLAAYRGEALRTAPAFELRFSMDEGTRLTLLEAGVFDNRNDADNTVFDGETPRKGAAQQSAVIPPILIPRSAWGAEPFRGTPVPLSSGNYVRMTFHHAAGFSADTYEEGLAQVKAIQDFHQNGRGWSDIGYHFVVDRGGRVYQGRPFLDNAVTLDDVPAFVLGAHVGGANTGNVGVCLLGCYHPPETAYACNQEITPAALDSMVTLFAFLSESYGIDPDDLLGHRDQGQTACPGDNNYALLPEVREDIVRLKITGNARLGQAALTATTDADGIARLSWEFSNVNGIVGYRIERTYLGETTVVFEGEGTLPEAYSDPGLTEPGTAVYDLYAFNGSGRAQRLASTEVVVETPVAHILADNFPNPFQSHTTIRHYLAQSGIVTLRVFDGAGREVRTLVHAYLDGERWYVHTFDASGLASGIYYYRLQVEGFAGTIFDETKTLVVLR